MPAADDDGREAIRVTVFASAAGSTADAYMEAASDLGTRIARAGLITVFGGGNAGCMGALSDAVRAAGGKVHGISHVQFVGSSGIDLEEASGQGIRLDIVKGDDLSERKKRLIDAGHCLVCLPGGVGTFDELFMAIALVAVKLRELPIVVVNTDGYYDGTIAQLERAERDGLLRRPAREYVTFVRTPAEAVEWCLANVASEHSLSVEGLDDDARRGTVSAALETLPGVRTVDLPGTLSADAAAGCVRVSGKLRVPTVLQAIDAAGAVASWQGAKPLARATSEPPPRLSPSYARGLAMGVAMGVALGVGGSAVVALARTRLRPW